jgi:hypothetical protein
MLNLNLLQRFFGITFTIDDEGQEALVDSAYDTTQYFVSLYDFSTLAESDDNTSPGAL